MALISNRFGVEAKGIEFVPLTERYGTPRRLFTIWFSVNLSILCLTVGTLGIFAGLSLGWTLVALVIGNIIGTIFMAAHSAQGPHLGIPQMIQSRAQFGVFGAGLPLIAVVAMSVFYTAANAILIGDTVRMILPVSSTTAVVLFAIMTLFIAFVGYELIHRVGAVLAYLSGILFAAVAALLYLHPRDGAAAAPHVFHAATFLLVTTQATAWSLSSAPTVADYSRYLPPTVSSWVAFWYTGMGNFLASTVIMSIGAFMAAGHPDLATHVGVGIAELFGPGKRAVAALIVANLLQVNVMVLYSGYMSVVTMLTGVRGMQRVRLRQKFVLMTGLMATATVTAIATQSHFDAYFSDLLAILLYSLVPWSAINLADYYVVRKGRYSIGDLYTAKGMYGALRWRTIGVYLISIAVQIPFMQLSFYEGPVIRFVGSDIAWLPGTLVPTLLYIWAERRALSYPPSSVRTVL